MSLKIGSWNIGGGVPGPSHQRNASTKLEYYAAFLNETQPDILCIQEAHSYDDGRNSQIQELSEQTGYAHFVQERVSPSHVDETAHFALGILSRFPIENVQYARFPRFEISSTGPDGQKWSIHEKGLLVARLQIGRTLLTIINAHCYPLHYFHVSPLDARVAETWLMLDETLVGSARHYPTVACIDLNCDNLHDLLRESMAEGRFRSAINNTATTPKGVQQDFLLFDSSFRLSRSSATATESDHSYCEMTLEHQLERKNRATLIQ